MGKTKYFIHLSDEEVEKLKNVVQDPANSTIRKVRAEILLSLNDRKPNYTIVDHLAFTYGVSKSMIYRLMTGYTKRGIDSVKRKASPPPTKPYKMTEEIEKRVMEWLQTPPPNGRKKWSAYLLADKVVEEGLAKKMSYMTIYRLLDKLGLKC